MLKRMLVLLFSLTAVWPGFSGNQNLLKNGGFEIERNGYYVYWNTEAFINNEKSVRFYTSAKESFEGKQSFGIANLAPNDSKVIQWVDVEPDTLYRLSCRIKAKKVEGAEIGANLSVLGIKGSSKSVFNTKNKWQYVEIYGKTGPLQKELAVVARLGFYGNLVTGIVYFDDIRLEKTESAPTKNVLNFFNANEKFVEIEEKYVKPISDQNPLMMILVLIICFLVLSCSVIFLYLYVLKPVIKKFLTNAKKKNQPLPAGGQTLVPNAAEKRKAKRKRVKLNITIRQTKKKGGFTEMVFHTFDISTGGMFVLVDNLDAFTIEDKIELQVEKSGQKYDMGKARVVRLQQEFDKKGVIIEKGIGIQFLSTTPEQITWLIHMMGEDKKEEKEAEKTGKKPGKKKTGTVKKKVSIMDVNTK